MFEVSIDAVSLVDHVCFTPSGCNQLTDYAIKAIAAELPQPHQYQLKVTSPTSLPVLLFLFSLVLTSVTIGSDTSWTSQSQLRALEEEKRGHGIIPWLFRRVWPCA